MRWGVISTGSIANDFSLQLKCTPGAVLHAVASRSQKAADEFATKHGFAHAYPNYEALVADPVQLLADFLALAARHGDDPRPGQWVATGGITPCRDFAAGARVTVRMGDREMIDFRAATGGQP